LDVGVSIDEQLYIKKHPGGIAKLQQGEMIFQDNSSPKHKISKKTASSSKTSSITSDDNQVSCEKLGKKEKKKVCCKIFFGGEPEKRKLRIK